MSRIRLLATMATLLMALSAHAQQNAGANRNADKHPPAQQDVPNTEEHVNMLSQNLDLTAEQQGKVRPLIQNMLDDREKVMHDQSLSSDQRHEKLRVLHEKADRELRKLLNDDQKKKLDELEAQHRPEAQRH